jgi:hypothetical protein
MLEQWGEQHSCSQWLASDVPQCYSIRAASVNMEVS